MRALLPPEAQFLILTTAGRANDAAMLEILEHPFDWALLCEFARADRAIPVVWRCLQRLGCAVPGPVAEYLGRAAAVSEFEMLRGEARLRETICALGRESIRVILLKGAAVVHAAYDSFTERPMADFDLLVDESRIDDAQRLAQSVGWTRSPGAAPDFAYRTHHHAVPLVDQRGTGMQLELHTGLFIEGHPFGLSTAMVRHRARPLDIDGCLVGVPVRSILMLHACLHFAWSHGMRKGGWRTLRDIAHLADGRAQVWDEFVQLAIDARGATCCYWTLRLARDLAAIPVSDHVLGALQPPLPEPVLARIARHFALQLFASDVVCPSAVVERALWNAAVMPAWSGHRRARPWDRTSDFMPDRSPGSRVATARTNISRQLAMVPEWSRYLRAVLAGSSRGRWAPINEGGR